MEISIQIIGSYLLFLFIQALFINGIKAASNGETEISPSGRVIDGEMILYPLYKFIMQYSIRKDYYGEEIWKKIHTIFPQYDLTVPFTIEESDKIWKVLKSIEDPDIKFDFNEFGIAFYKEYKEYKFSKYIRKPIIQCIICMPSFWGLLTYWPIISYLYGVNIYTVLLWIVNTVCLSYVCYLIYKPVK